MQRRTFSTKNGFSVNKRLQKGLEIQLNTLKLPPVYDDCKKQIQSAKENIDKIDSLQSTPGTEFFIYEYFEKFILIQKFLLNNCKKLESLFSFRFFIKKSFMF